MTHKIDAVGQRDVDDKPMGFGLMLVARDKWSIEILEIKHVRGSSQIQTLGRTLTLTAVILTWENEDHARFRLVHQLSSIREESSRGQKHDNATTNWITLVITLVCNSPPILPSWKPFECLIKVCMFNCKLDEEAQQIWLRILRSIFFNKWCLYLLRVDDEEQSHIYFTNIDHCFNLHTHCCDTYTRFCHICLQQVEYNYYNSHNSKMRHTCKGNDVHPIRRIGWSHWNSKI